VQQSPLAKYITEERYPGPGLTSDAGAPQLQEGPQEGHSVVAALKASATYLRCTCGVPLRTAVCRHVLPVYRILGIVFHNCKVHVSRAPATIRR
jgi:hypothetical protein